MNTIPTKIWKAEQIVAFHVSDEVQVQGPAKLERLKRQFIALGLFRANAQNADPWILVAKDFAGVNAAHHGVMRQVQGFALDISAGRPGFFRRREQIEGGWCRMY